MVELIGDLKMSASSDRLTTDCPHDEEVGNSKEYSFVSKVRLSLNLGMIKEIQIFSRTVLFFIQNLHEPDIIGFSKVTTERCRRLTALQVRCESSSIPVWDKLAHVRSWRSYCIDPLILVQLSSSLAKLHD
ncbi:hypothetical protein KIN20_013070 [Parelaphostrongylus tenuis]|uniref:Uncharacterized protein n=1 Tax=Parelaphostrongylus tenuis TaxID=148309 RepID=A0AAD5MBM4_PARTN|nr:hypothetical protein KIN20_013070 [Parelaphostrongylus tenuis]